MGVPPGVLVSLLTVLFIIDLYYLTLGSMYQGRRFATDSLIQDRVCSVLERLRARVYVIT